MFSLKFDKVTFIKPKKQLPGPKSQNCLKINGIASGGIEQHSELRDKMYLLCFFLRQKMQNIRHFVKFDNKYRVIVKYIIYDKDIVHFVVSKV